MPMMHQQACDYFAGSRDALDTHHIRHAGVASLYAVQERLSRYTPFNTVCFAKRFLCLTAPISFESTRNRAFALSSMSNVGQGANKPYPQEVTLDAAKAEAAKMQSDASKAHGGTIPKNDPASAARVRDRHLITPCIGCCVYGSVPCHRSTLSPRDKKDDVQDVCIQRTLDPV